MFESSVVRLYLGMHPHTLRSRISLLTIHCAPLKFYFDKAENVLLPGNAQPNVPKNPGMRYSDWLSDYVRFEFFGPSTGDTHVPLSVYLPVRIIVSF